MEPVRKVNKPEHKEISLTLKSTDMPDVPIPLPIGSTVSVAGGQLHIKCNGIKKSFEFGISKEEIQSVKAEIVEDVPDDFEDSPWNQPECSSITIFHDDPYKVVDAFQTTFESTKSYWIKALSKVLKDNFDIDTSIEEKPS